MWIKPKTDWSKGEWFNYEDWNRIETDIQYLADYYDISIQSYTWDYYSIPTLYMVVWVKERVNILCELLEIAPLPINRGYPQMFQFGNMNEIEKKLLLVYNLSMADVFRTKRTGAFCCGQSIYLPGVMI